MSEEVKGEGPNNLLPMDKATRDAANAGRHAQYEFEFRSDSGCYGSPITDMETS
jgi:hypothetical protein